MGIFSTIRQLFNKNIDCGEDISQHVVFLLKKKKYLYLNKNIIVRDGSVAVIVFNHRVCDVIIPGKYKLNEQSIPLTYAKAKIDKKSKKGRKIRKVRADIFFVSTSETADFDFDSDDAFHIKSKEVGRVKGYLQGTCTMRVIDPAKLIKALLSQMGKFKAKKVKREIGLLIGNKINRKIQKEKTNIDDIFDKNSRINTILNSDL